MYNISTNPYIMPLSSPGDYDLNRFIFVEHSVKSDVGRSDYALSTHELLATLGFSVHLIGYKYLSLLLDIYLNTPDFIEQNAIESIANLYITEPKRVYGNINAAIAYNNKFIRNASMYLSCDIECGTPPSIKDTLEITGALFKSYYNENVTEPHADIGLIFKLMDFKRFINDGKDNNKDSDNRR